MMLTDLPLFAQPVVPPLHRRRDPSTSRDAAAKVARKLSPLHAQVIDAVAAAGARGLTGGELEQLPQFADLKPSTARKRASELHHLGRLRHAGRRDGMTVYVLDGAA
jgi:hypothetical protein